MRCGLYQDVLDVEGSNSAGNEQRGHLQYGLVAFTAGASSLMRLPSITLTPCIQETVYTCMQPLKHGP